MAKLNELKIREAHEGLEAKRFSAKELLDDCYKAVKAKNKDLNAFITLDEDGAYKSAEQVDKKIAKGGKLHVLEGIPAGIKDILNTKGIKTTCASPFLKDFVPPYDATVIEKLKESGLVMVGKTNLDEFACGSSSRICLESSPKDSTSQPHQGCRSPAQVVSGRAVCDRIGTGMVGAI